MTDSIEATRPLTAIRDEIATQLDEAVQSRRHGEESHGRVSYGTTDVANLAAALGDASRAAAAVAQNVPPPFDPAEFATKIWNRLQEAGHPTQVSDDAVTAIHDELKAAA